MNRVRYACKYILHFVSARHTRGFGVHSPFLFQLTRNIIYDESSYYIFPEIERIRKKLLSNHNKLNIIDFGTGKDRPTTVRAVASKSLKSAKYGQLLFKITNFIKAQSILELGTSFGLTTSYLAASCNKIKCITLEGSPESVEIAKQNFKKLGIENIQLIMGNIDVTLSDAIGHFETLDLIFIDANHRMPAAYSYFELCLNKIHENSIVIIDDIYWSSEMEIAWKMIKNHPQVTSTIDLFQLGMVFFRTDLHKKHYKMWF